MTRIPLSTVDDGDDDPVELPCESCGTPTVERLEYGGHTAACCGRSSCEVWVTSGINGRNAPTVSWDEID